MSFGDLIYPGIAEGCLVAAFDTLNKCVVDRATSPLTHPFIAPGGYGEDWWQIDSSVALEGYKWFDLEFAKDGVRNFIEAQRADGRIPLYGNDTLPVSPHHPPQSNGASSLPKLFESAYGIAQMSGDGKFTAEVYEMLKNYLSWWLNSRRDVKTGLISSLFEETFPPYLGYAMEYCGPDTNVEVAIGAKICGLLADELGYDDDAAWHRKTSRELFSAAQRYLWNQRLEAYTPYSLINNAPIDLLSVQGFGMLCDVEIPLSRKEKTLSLMKGDSFLWGKFPLSSVSKHDKTFTITRGETYQYNESWSGMTWTLTNRDVIRALMCAGESGLASELADRTLLMSAGNYREFFDPNDGTGHGARNYAWTAACFITILIETIMGISYDFFHKRINVKPNVPKRLRGEKLAATVRLPNKKVAKIEVEGSLIRVTE